jgi:hypothetical protein
MYLKLKEQGGRWSLSLRIFLTSLPRTTVKCQPDTMHESGHYLNIVCENFNVPAKFTNSLKSYL